MKDSFNQNPTPEQVDAFVLAAGRGDNVAVEKFADKFPQSLETLNFRTYIRQTALMTAAIGGHAETVKLLLAKGAAVDGQNGQGMTALNYAANSGRTEVVELLLKNGARIDAEKGNRLAGGWTVLMGAVWNLHVDTVNLLIKNGASVAEKDESGMTALDHAHRHLNQILDNQTLDKEIKDDWLDKTRQVVTVLEKAQETQTTAPKKRPVRRFKF
jgi:ankyrin repeat protein